MGQVAGLARRAGTSQAAVARYESGAASPSVSTLERVLSAAALHLELGVSPAEGSDLSGRRAAPLRHHRRDIARLVKAAWARNVRVFGSVARGDDVPSSDINLLIDFDLTQGLMPIVRLKRALEDLLHEPVDVAPFDLLKPSVAERALREAVPL